jgi:hypothetical protein
MKRREQPFKKGMDDTDDTGLKERKKESAYAIPGTGFGGFGCTCGFGSVANASFAIAAETEVEGATSFEAPVGWVDPVGVTAMNKVNGNHVRSKLSVSLLK